MKITLSIAILLLIAKSMFQECEINQLATGLRELAETQATLVRCNGTLQTNVSLLNRTLTDHLDIPRQLADPRRETSL